MKLQNCGGDVRGGDRSEAVERWLSNRNAYFLAYFVFNIHGGGGVV